MTILTFIAIGLIIKYAPAATKKKPIPVRLIKRKNITQLLLV